MCSVVEGEHDDIYNYIYICNSICINNDVPIMRDARYSSWLQNLLISSLLSPRLSDIQSKHSLVTSLAKSQLFILIITSRVLQ